MSSTESNIHESLARRLEGNGFKKTSLAQAVWELVQSYIVGHTNPGENIQNALINVKANLAEVVPSQDKLGPIGQSSLANDNQFDVKKTGTHG